MYHISIENGEVDYNQVGEIQATGYLQDDITNGCLTELQFIQSKKEVNDIVRIVRKTAIDIHVYKLVKIENSKALQKQVDSNPW